MSTDELPQNDAELKEALAKLFPEWEEKLKEKFDKELKEKYRKEFGFSKDGALSGYFKQKYKILSIGRESHSKTPNLNTLVDQFLSGGSAKDRDGGILREGEANGLICWQLMARVVYGLLNGIEDWNKIPEKEELEKPFRDGEFSFAVMNVSKYEHAKNKDGEYPTGLSEIFEDCAYESLGGKEEPFSRNFTREEIDLLDPDLIIAWNLARKPGVPFLKRLADPCTGRYYPSKLEPVSIWTYKSSKGREIPLINSYHFSYPGKNTENYAAHYYYNPIRDAVKKLIAQGELKG